MSIIIFISYLFFPFLSLYSSFFIIIIISSAIPLKWIDRYNRCPLWNLQQINTTYNAKYKNNYDFPSFPSLLFLLLIQWSYVRIFFTCCMILARREKTPLATIILWLFYLFFSFSFLLLQFPSPCIRDATLNTKKNK